MKRIAIVRQRFNPAGGAERFVSRALEALDADGRMHVTLLARQWKTHQPSSHFEYVTLNPFYLGNVWRDFSFARAVMRHADQAMFDLVQSHERIWGCDIFRAGDGVHAQWLHLRRRTLSFWGRLGLRLNPYHAYTCWAENRLFRHPALKAVICNSKIIRDDIMRRFGLPKERLPVIYNGIDTSAFHPDLALQHRTLMRRRWKIPPDVPLLLFVGSGFERKGVGRVLDVLAGVPQAYALIVGDDRHVARYQAQARRLALGSRVHFAGVQQDVKPFYGAADALILPTLYDPFPNACLEALASGLPVFTTATCGAADWITPGETGGIRDVLDIEGQRQDIMNWIAARGQWAQWSFAARRLAEPYTLQATASALIALYEQLLEQLPDI